jgi:hypothetical protein
LLALELQPFLETFFLDEFQVGHHGPVVRPFVVHEFMKRRAWIVSAKTAGIDVLVCGALPEPASLYIVVRAGAAAAIAVLRPAGAVLGLFHGQTLFMVVDVLLVASQRIEGCSISC